MSTLDQIKALIFELRGSYKFELVENTLLQKDLDIYGDDAYEFIERFRDTVQNRINKLRGPITAFHLSLFTCIRPFIVEQTSRDK